MTQIMNDSLVSIKKKFYLIQLCNFIMPKNRKPEPQSQPNRQHRKDQKDQHLQVQILRVQAIQKNRIAQQMWQMSQNQLCDFFMKYDLFPQDYLTIDMLLDSPRLKLVKSQGKIYFGEVDRKQRHGWGIQIQKSGHLYEGQFHSNEKRGRGIQIYSNSNLYLGQFLNNKKHGHGHFFWFNLSTRHPKGQDNTQNYKGDWWGGLPDGEGIHRRNNGDQYIGTFKNGLKHGQGEENYGNGDYYKGEFINGLPEGYGEYLWKDLSSYKGDFKQGQRSGYGVWKVNDHGLQNYQGHYSADKKTGYGIYTWNNGWCYKGNFDNDYRNGFGQLFDSQQQLSYSGDWFNGQQVSRSKPKMENYQKYQDYNPEHNSSEMQQDDPSFQKSTQFSRKFSAQPSTQRYQSAQGFRQQFNLPQQGQYAALSTYAEQNLCKRPQKSQSNLMSKGIRIRPSQVGTKIARPLAPGPSALLTRNAKSSKKF